MDGLEALGYVSLAAGLGIALLAGKLPMNTIVGFRVGLTFMSRRIWVMANRFMGLGLALAGLATLYVRPRLGPYTIPTYIIIVLLHYSVILVWAWREARREASMKPPAPVSYVALRPISPGVHRYLASLVVTLTPLAFNHASVEVFIYVVPGLLSLGLCIAASLKPILFYNPWVPAGSMFKVLHEVSILAGVVSALASPGSPFTSHPSLLGYIALLVASYSLARMALVMRSSRLLGGS